MTAQPNDAREAFEAIFGPDAEHNPTYNAALSHQSSELREASVERDFWKEEYKLMILSAIERMAELGHAVDPADKMMKAAEYRLEKIIAADRIANEEGK